MAAAAAAAAAAAEPKPDREYGAYVMHSVEDWEKVFGRGTGVQIALTPPKGRDVQDFIDRLNRAYMAAKGSSVQFD